ncbi:hypothetical protein RCL1_008670 [Eukaryota sp. TZLM3-RCL]
MSKPFRFRKYIPVVVLVLQLLFLIFIIVANVLEDNIDYGTIGFISTMSCCGAARILFIIGNSIAYALTLYIQLYLGYFLRQYLAQENYEFVNRKKLTRIYFDLAFFVVPILFISSVILIAVFDSDKFSAPHVVVVYVWGYGVLFHLITVTFILSWIRQNAGPSTRFTTRRSVLLKQLLLIILLILAVVWITFHTVFSLKPSPEGFTIYVISALIQWSIWVTVWCWIASYYYEVLKVDRERFGQNYD